MYLQDKQEQGK